MIKLKPCPFCGAQPDTFPKDPKTEGDAWASVKCVNLTCGANPELKIYEDACYNDGDEHGRWLVGQEIYEEAMQRWNTRAGENND